MAAIRLNHVCEHPGCVGLPGSIVVCDDELAAKMIDRGGAVMVDRDAQPKRGPGRPPKQPKVAVKESK